MSGRITCASGSPSRTLNSITFGPGSRQHQADIEEAAKGCAFGRHAGDDRLDDLAHDALVQRRVDERARRERAHAAGVRPAIVVEDPLVVLRGADRQGAYAVAEHEERHFGSDQALFDHQPVAGGAEASARSSPRATAASASARSAAMTTPLPAASPSALSTTGNPNVARRDAPAPRRPIEVRKRARRARRAAP